MATRNDNPVPARATHPGEILREELRERGIKQKEFAQMIEVAPSHLNEFIKGKRDLSESLAMKLEKQLNIPYTIWMNLQNGYNYDIKVIEERNAEEHDAHEFEQACSALFNLHVVYKRLGLQSLSITERVSELKRISPIDLLHPQQISHAFAGKFKHSVKAQIDEKNMLAWLILNKIEVSRVQQECREFIKGNAMKAASEISRMANSDTLSINAIRKCLNSYGIQYVEVPKVDKAPVDAYSTIEESHPVITVTYRYNDMDKLAFDILHELCHIENHLSENQKEFISVEGADYEHDEQEREANKFAMNQLIPEETWNRIMKEGCTDLSPYKIVKTIATKAKLYGISPSIAVSRYKHDTNWYQTNSYRSPKIH